MDSVERIAKNAIVAIVSLWLLKNAVEHIFFEANYIGFFGHENKKGEYEN